MAVDVREYSAPGVARNGCLGRHISKSAYRYQMLKMFRGESPQVPRIENNLDRRYGCKTTPTTRRTDYDHTNRRYY